MIYSLKIRIIVITCFLGVLKIYFDYLSHVSSIKFAICLINLLNFAVNVLGSIKLAMFCRNFAEIINRKLISE